MKEKNKVDRKLFFSIIVPAKNEENNIVKTLKNIQNINYDKNNYEVIIINDNSTDNTLEIINNLNLPNNFKIINRQRTTGYVSGVLNDAIENISKYSDIVGIVDSDCLVSLNILQSLNEYFTEEIDGIQCQEWHYNNSFNHFTRAQHITCIYENYQNLKHNNFKVGHFYRSKIFSKIKYNEKSILEDLEYSTNMKENNYKIISINDVLIFRKFPINFYSIYSQQYRYQLGNIILNNNKIINEDIFLSIIILINFICFLFFNDLINFIKVNFFILLLSYSVINNALVKYFNITIKSCKLNSENIIKNTENINYKSIDIFLGIIFGFFVLCLRIIPLIRYNLNIEKIKWNRFS